jgi:hypothetical protein
MSDRTFGTVLKRVHHFDDTHQLCEPILRWLAMSPQAVAVAQEPVAPAPVTNCAAAKALPRELAVENLPIRITGRGQLP